MLTLAEQDQFFNTIEADISKMINRLEDTPEKTKEVKMEIWRLKNLLKVFDEVNQERIYKPLTKYVDIKYQFPGCPRN